MSGDSRLSLRTCVITHLFRSVEQIERLRLVSLSNQNSAYSPDATNEYILMYRMGMDPLKDCGTNEKYLLDIVYIYNYNTNSIAFHLSYLLHFITFPVSKYIKILLI